MPRSVSKNTIIAIGLFSCLREFNMAGLPALRPFGVKRRQRHARHRLCLSPERHFCLAAVAVAELDLHGFAGGHGLLDALAVGQLAFLNHAPVVPDNCRAVEAYAVYEDGDRFAEA